MFKLRAAAVSLVLVGMGAVFVELPAGVAHAQPPTPSKPTAGPTASLLDNANYWRSHGEPRFALRELDRVLSYAPTNADVLAAAAEVAFDIDDYTAAARYRSMLAKAAPADPRNQLLAAEHARTPEETATLNEARSLARDGKTAEAIARFKQLFHDGTVPPSLAIEYYTLLGSTPDGFDEANEKLGAIAERVPNEARIQLAYAKLLILQEATRADGIRRLAALSSNPDVEKASRQAWRDALLWQGASERSRAQLATYLQTNPTDPAIEAKRREFDAVLPDESAKAMIRGYNAMATDPAAAEHAFMAALAINPKNPDALVMIAAIRRAQGRMAEAQLLIDRAVALAPDRRDELIKSAGGDYAVSVPANMAERVEVARLAATGHYGDAERLLSELITGRETPTLLIQLGDLQRRAGHLNEAEASFLRVREMAPANGEAANGLASVLAQEGRYDDASAQYALAAALFARVKNPAGQRRVAIGRADLLQLRLAQSDFATASAAYETAIAREPKDIYLRANFASLLLQNGKADQAWALLNKGIQLDGSDRASLQAALGIAVQAGDQQRTQEWSQRLGRSGAPAPLNTADQQERVQADIRQASQAALQRSASFTVPGAPAAATP